MPDTSTLSRLAKPSKAELMTVSGRSSKVKFGKGELARMLAGAGDSLPCRSEILPIVSPCMLNSGVKVIGWGGLWMVMDELSYRRLLMKTHVRQIRTYVPYATSILTSVLRT